MATLVYHSPLDVVPDPWIYRQYNLHFEDYLKKENMKFGEVGRKQLGLGIIGEGVKGEYDQNILYEIVW